MYNQIIYKNNKKLIIQRIYKKYKQNLEMIIERHNSQRGKIHRKRGISLSIKESQKQLSAQKVQNHISSLQTSNHRYQLSQFTQRECIKKDDSLKKVIRYDSVINIHKKQDERLNESINQSLIQRYHSSNYKRVPSQLLLNNKNTYSQENYIKIIEQKDKIIKQLQQHQKHQLNHIESIQQNFRKLQERNYLIETQNKQLKMGIKIQKLPDKEEKSLTNKENILKVVVKEQCLKNIKNSRIKYLSNPIYQIQAKLNRILNQIKS